MAVSPLSSPVVLDGTLSDEKLEELLALKTEYPELDFKTTLEVTSTEGVVELAKDVGAMQVRGAYIIAGVDGQGVPTGNLDDADMRVFDEANLAPKLRRYLPDPLELRTRALNRDGHTIVVIYVGRHPSGCAIFQADGKYEKNGQEVVKFRSGEVFWRDGTRSVRLTQQGFEEIVARRIAESKRAWLEEQQGIRRHEQAELEAAYQSRNVAAGPLGAVNFDLEESVLTTAALEFVRVGDAIALRHLLMDATARARTLIEQDEIDTALGDVVDKLACLAATFLVYEEAAWFEAVISTLREIFSLGFGDDDPSRFGYSAFIDPKEVGPRVWLMVIERIYALGALAVRRGGWKSVRTLTLQLPGKVDPYYGNWLRYALTMASRAQHLRDQQGGQTIELSLLSRVRGDTSALACVRTDRIDDEMFLTSLTQFDILSNLVAIDAAGSADDRVFYPNFARFRQARIQPIVDRLLTDHDMRQTLFPRGNEELAIALDTLAKNARAIGFRYDGFWSWERTAVGAFIAEHLPRT